MINICMYLSHVLSIYLYIYTYTHTYIYILLTVEEVLTIVLRFSIHSWPSQPRKGALNHILLLYLLAYYCFTCLLYY